LAWPKGKKRPPGSVGRKKGVPNKVTRNARAEIGRLLDGQSHKLPKWLDAVRRKEGPGAAISAYTKLLEYHVPKLARTEIQGNLTVSLEELLKVAATRRAAGAAK
jgi:hypothetical protein